MNIAKSLDSNSLAPNPCGSSLLQNLGQLIAPGGITTGVSKRSPDQKTSPGMQVNAIVKLAKREESGRFREAYWTETVNISARSDDGRKLFQSFHIIAVPEGKSEDFKRLRKQMRESLLSEFQRIYEESGRS